MTPEVISKSMAWRNHDVISPLCSTLARTSLDYVAILESLIASDMWRCWARSRGKAINMINLGERALLTKPRGPGLWRSRRDQWLGWKIRNFGHCCSTFQRCASETICISIIWDSCNKRRSCEYSKPTKQNFCWGKGRPPPSPRIMRAEVENLCARASRP